MLSNLLFILFNLALHAQADNLLARSEDRRLKTTTVDISLEELTKEQGGCFSRDEEDNDHCSAITTEGECWVDPDCKWKSSCEERKFNLFEFPKEENFCWLIRDDGKTKDDAKNKGACKTQECKNRCGQSYRRSPRGKKARLCYWDPLKEKCRGGNRYVVDEERCPFLPAAPKTPSKQCVEKVWASGPVVRVEGPTTETECMMKVMELEVPSRFFENRATACARQKESKGSDCLWSAESWELPTHLGYTWYQYGNYNYCWARGVLEDPEMHANSYEWGGQYSTNGVQAYKTCWLNTPISA